MKEWFQQQNERFLALEKRERLLVLATVFVVLIVGLQSFVVEPLWEQRQSLLQQQRTLTVELQELNGQVQSQEIIASMDPNEPVLNRIEVLNLQMEHLESELNENIADLIGPQQMRELLQQMFRTSESLSLQRMKVLPAQPLQLANSDTDDEDDNQQKAAGDQAEERLYRHRFEVEYSGSYFDNLAFLQAMEQLPWSFYWEQIEYRVDDYPEAKIRLLVETLSDDQAIIGI